MYNSRITNSVSEKMVYDADGHQIVNMYDAAGNVLKKAGTWGDIGIKNIVVGKYGNNVVFKIYGLDPISGEYEYKEY